MPKEIIRVRCPLCGMMPSLENLKHTQADKPAEVRVFIQRMGGKKKPEGGAPTYEKKGRGQAPGVMEYEDVTEQYPELAGQMEEWFKARVKLFEGGTK